MSYAKGVFHFFNWGWYNDWEISIDVIENIPFAKLSEESIDKILKQCLGRTLF